MVNTRKDVWKLADGWNPTLLWYAKGVALMQSRPIKDRTSWRYLAAMHGIDPPLWKAFGYLADTDKLPTKAEQGTYWNQCQHQTWYFLPWHRGYVAAFEAIVRAAVVSLSGPADWALPYWNYNDTLPAHANSLPTCFTLPTLPDGSANPLAVKRRYGPAGDGKVTLQPADIALDALKDPDFTGGSSGGSTGFGGRKTRFSHSGAMSSTGMLENQPHNIVHSLIGGTIRGADPNDGTNDGLMAMPDTAALDPIFWLHHANIDRLWVVWIKRSATPHHKNPSDAPWLTGPQRKFIVPTPTGTGRKFAAQDMLDTRAPHLNYVYEDVSDPFGGASRLAERMTRLNAPASVRELLTLAESSMSSKRKAELIGANEAPLKLEGAPVETAVRIDPQGREKLVASFATSLAAASTATPTEPDRVFLNLENIRGKNDAAVFYVYVDLAPGADPAQHPDHLAGAVSLFGVRKASQSDDAHAGNGITHVLEITKVVDALHLAGKLDAQALKVRFVPRTDVQAEDQISVGRVSLFREGH